VDVAFSQGFDGDPGLDGVLPTPPAGDVLAPPVAADNGSLSTLEELIRANAAGIAELREMMRTNAANFTVLSNTVTTTSSQLTSMSAALMDATETAARAYRLASNAQTTITAQGVNLGALAANVSTLTSDIDDLRTSIKTPLDLLTLIESALDPLRQSVVDSVALATETAEAMIRSSFDNSATTLDDKVRDSLEAFDKRIDALGSSYGHLMKTTLPKIAHRLDALDARARTPTPPPADKIDPSADKIDPSDDDTNKKDGVALEEHDDARSMSLRALDRRGPRLVRATALTLIHPALPQRVPLALHTTRQLVLVGVSSAPPLRTHTISRRRRCSVIIPPSVRPPSPSLCMDPGRSLGLRMVPGRSPARSLPLLP
jgi:hypothetical protein